MKKIRLPQLIIGGAAKSGTTTLYNSLLANKSFFFPEHKEPYFFSFNENDKRVNEFDPSFAKLIYRKLENYTALFEEADELQIVGEASTSYLYTSATTIKNITKLYACVGQELPKMYFILRNPVDRAWSHHQFLCQRGVENLDFKSAIDPHVVSSRLKRRFWDFDYLEYGKYSEGVNNFLNCDIESKFYLMDDFENPGLDSIVTEIERDFGLTKSRDSDKAVNSISNPSGKPKNELVVALLARDNALKTILRNTMPRRARVILRKLRDKVLPVFLEKQTMDPELRKQLLSYYKNDFEKLSLLLSRNLCDWNKS